MTTPASEALWVLKLPAPRAVQWNALQMPVTPMTVAIAVDALANGMRVDSQLVGSHPTDQVAVQAVQHYKRQHGRAPNPVYVDHAEFHCSPRLRRLCQRLGIELRIVSSHGPKLATKPSPAPRHQTADEVGFSSISSTGRDSESHEPCAESIDRQTVLLPWRRSLWELSLRRIGGRTGRRLRAESPRHEGEGSGDSGVE